MKRLAPIFALISFIVLLATFAWTLVDFHSDIETWARRDLRLRAQLAADTLRTPLKTQDFRRIGEIAKGLKDDHGLLLSVYSDRGGLFYRTAMRFGPDHCLCESAKAGDYRIELGRFKGDVNLPFDEALTGFILAALVGIAGMFAVFFVLYRQRVRIRELARLEAFRSAFIADVSHEIKTPLTGILGAVDLLEGDEGERRGEGDEVERKGGGGDRRGRLVDMIRKESTRLQGLVQQILDLARLEREGEVLHRVDTDLTALVADLATRYRISFKPLTRGCLVASVDPQLIEQALVNLIENAQRHAQTTDISIVLESTDTGVRLIVEDHGIGVPPAEREKIFDRFHRLDPSRAAESGGAGLGLAIVRRIAQLHAGSVVCEQADPQGSCFILTLPKAGT